MRALATFHGTVARLLQDSAASQMDWNSLLANLRHLGHDPNWRRRPSVLDTIQGLAGTPGRKRNQKAAIPGS